MNTAHGTRTHYWAMTPDGEQIVVPVEKVKEGEGTSALHLILNWMKEQLPSSTPHSASLARFKFLFQPLSQCVKTDILAL